LVQHLKANGIHEKDKKIILDAIRKTKIFYRQLF
jgi:hypothetical protein